jgi:spermidine synthase
VEPRDIYTCASAYHAITVTEIGYRRILRFEHNRQSSMYTDDPYETDFEYPGYFHLALAIRPDSTRTLVIGLGGGTVVKRMWRDYPDMRIDAVEIDPAVVDVARRFFALPDDVRIRVVTGDGRRFLETTPERYDIVIIDAFDDGSVPVPLRTEECLRAVRDRLEEGGVIVYNVIGTLTGDRSKPIRGLYRQLAGVWRHVWVFVIEEGVDAEGNNLIMLASDTEITVDELRERIADRVNGRVTVPAFHLFGRDLYTRPIRTGDVRTLTDPPRRGA